MTPRDLGNTTSLEIDVGTHCRMRHDTKSTAVFLTSDGEASWSLLPSSVYLLLSGGSTTRKHLFPYPQGDRSGLESQKRQVSTLTTTTTSIHLPKLVSTDLKIQIQF